MSSDRTKPPIMTDAIMYYSNARPKPVYGYTCQPAEACIGLSGYKNDTDVKNEQKLGNVDTLQQNPVDKLATQKGFSHTGCQVGLNYKRPAHDPRFNTRKYGNEKPLLINFSYK